MEQTGETTGAATNDFRKCSVGVSKPKFFYDLPLVPISSADPIDFKMTQLHRIPAINWIITGINEDNFFIH